MAKNLVKQIRAAQTAQIAKLVKILKDDPIASEEDIAAVEESLESILLHIIAKDGNLARGIVNRTKHVIPRDETTSTKGRNKFTFPHHPANSDRGILR